MNAHEQQDLMSQAKQAAMEQAYQDRLSGLGAMSAAQAQLYKEYQTATAQQLQAQMKQAMANPWQPPRSINIGKSTLHEDDVKDLHGMVDFLKYVLATDPKMRELHTAWKAQRSLTI